MTKLFNHVATGRVRLPVAPCVASLATFPGLPLARFQARLPARLSANFTARCLSILVVISSAIANPAWAETAVKFANDWKWEGPAAPLLMALDRGYYEAEGLDVTLDTGKGSLEAIPRVASGTYDMGAADINSLIKFRDKNPDIDLKAIFVIYNSPPFAIIGRKSQGVSGPMDLEGKVLGAPAADGAFAQWKAFVRANGIDADQVTIENVGFPVREPMLAQGKVDAITGFSFSSYINLKANGVPTDDISLMLMSDFGLDLYGNVIIVNPDFAQENPDAVRSFLRATTRGFKDTIANPADAVKHVMNHNDVAREEVELERLIMAIGHHIATDEVRLNGIGSVLMARLEKSIEQISHSYDFDNQPTANEIFDEQYLGDVESRMLGEQEAIIVTEPGLDLGAQPTSASQ